MSAGVDGCAHLLDLLLSASRKPMRVALLRAPNGGVRKERQLLSG